MLVPEGDRPAVVESVEREIVRSYPPAGDGTGDGAGDLGGADGPGD